MTLRALPRWLHWKHVLWIAGGAWCFVGLACSTIGSSRAYQLAPAGTPGSSLKGNVSCAQCHEDHMIAFADTTHGRMRGDTSHSCEACHGPASKHISSGGEGAIVLPNDANCTACHGESHSGTTARGAKSPGGWAYSTHASAGVKCIDCHSGHATTAKQVKPNKAFRVQNMDDTSAMCMSCHQEMLAKTSMPSHHPIREGKMSCTSCHDPHGNPAQQLLAKNESCFQCHQAQQGPFSHEHSPVVEDCSSCHDPHGSPNPRMAKLAQPMLCTQCHTLTMNRHSNVLGRLSPAALRDCAACHGSIHGSDMDAYFRH